MLGHTHRFHISDENIVGYFRGCMDTVDCPLAGNVKGVRYGTLEKICIVLDCQPGDILEYRPDEDMPEEID